MELFIDIVAALRSCMEGLRREAPYRECRAEDYSGWPAGKRGAIVMKGDTAVELGNPQSESSSFLVWTNDRSLVRDGTITVAGTDLDEARGGTLPFGKVVILAVSGFTGENCHERHRAIELMRHDLNPEGYMMKAASQYMREWSRVSASAIERGFSLKHLGSSLVGLYRSAAHVLSAEVLFVTSSGEHVRRLAGIGERAARRIAAMSKMAAEMALDCGSCNYADVCGEVEGLRTLRDSLKKGTGHARE